MNTGPNQRPINPLPVHIWRDSDRRDGASHMALDEALFAVATHSLPMSCPGTGPDAIRLRCYEWAAPALTIGVFVPLTTVAGRAEPITRRWTGGGVVEHGEDITFSLAIPACGLEKGARAADFYRCIHEALAATLRENGLTGATTEPATSAGAPDPGFCFAAPVAWDVMDLSNGQKIAGGAQRRSRAGLLHQGSVRLPAALQALDHPWIDRFAEKLAAGAGIADFSPTAAEYERAEILRTTRYADPDWLARR